MKKFAAVALALLMTSTATPVAAQGFIDDTGSGGTGSTGVGNATLNCNNILGEGHNTARTPASLVYAWPYPGCSNRQMSKAGYEKFWGNDSASELCTVAWEVWRFYGSIEYPVQLMTVSRVNPDTYTGLNGGCLNDKKVAVFSPDPADVAPDAQAFFPPSGTDKNGRSGHAITPAGVKLYTPSPPFRWINAGASSCMDLRMPAEQVAATATRDNPSAVALYNDQVSKFGPDIAAAVVNNFSGDDAIACNSGLEYNGAQGLQKRIYGACFVPVEARAIHMYDWKATSFSPDRVEDAFHFVGGERYDSDRFPTGGGSLDVKYGPNAEPVDGGTPPVTADGRNVAEVVRDTIAWEVMTREGVDLTARLPFTNANVPLDRDGVQIVRPGEPYRWDWATNPPRTRDAAAAAAAASRNTRCELGPALDVEPQPTPPQTIEPAGSVTVRLEAPTRFFAGGTNRPQSVTATPGEFTCPSCQLPAIWWDNTPGPAPVLDSLSISVNVSSTGGFDAWREASRSADIGLSPRKVSLELFAATDATAQKMVVEASGSGTYRVTTGRERVNLTDGYYDIQGRPLPPVWTVVYTEEVRPLTVSFVPQSRLERPVVGATATGG